MTRFTCRKTAAVAAAGAVIAASLVAGANPAGAAQADDIPTVTNVSDRTLALSGGDVVSITGDNFLDETTPTSGVARKPDVYFDANDRTVSKSTNVLVVSDTRLIAVVPSTLTGTAGSRDVVVENSQGPSLDTVGDDVNFVATNPSAFTVLNAAGQTALFGSAAGGDVLTLVGTDLQKATKVTFDGVVATINKRSTGFSAPGVRTDKLVVRTPAHAATGDPIEIKVFTPKAKTGRVGATNFQYTAPITGASVSTGKVGTVVSLRGLSLDKVPAYDAAPTPDVQGLYLGSTPVTEYIVVSESEIVAVVPAGATTGKWKTDVDADFTAAANTANVTNEAAIESAITFTVTA